MATKEYFVAVHEAAHAIAAMALGTRVYSLRLEAGRDGNTCGQCTIGAGDDAISRYAIARAGEIAAGTRAGPESAEDQREQATALGLAAQATGDTICAMFEGDAMARAIITRNRALIRKLARRLIRKRRLIGDELEDIRARVRR